MHIKQVIIQGFKSFREQTVVEPFDPGHNAIVGRNGSGKTNFFNAIQFVLCNEYSRMRSDHIQNLLHEGVGPRVMSAYVEIIFDNSDGRLPIEKSEVFLRRVIGSKKDQYFLNKKLVPRNDVMNLLETAGFSQSNPYYIVKQGKINQMAIDPDTQRLKILREVAGTRVYDEKRRESSVLLKDTEGKLEKINELLTIIDDRLECLKEEKEELKEYQQCDNKRRYIEYLIYDRELLEYKKKLQDIKKLRDETFKPLQKDNNNKVKNAKAAVERAVESLKEIKKEVKLLKEKRSNLSSKQQDLLKQKSKLTLTISDLEDEVSGDSLSRRKAQEELDDLLVIISQREETLNEIRPKYEEIKIVEEMKTSELALKEQKRADLYAKLGRFSEFTNKVERDKWIRNEIEQLRNQIIEKQNHETRIIADLENDDKIKKGLEKKIEELERQVKSQNESINKSNKDLEEFINFKDRCQADRKEQYRKESILQLNITGKKEELAKEDQSLRSMVGISLLNGRDSVQRVLKTFRERGDPDIEVDSCYGLLIDNFTCKESVFTAVEVIAGSRLFYHIIETDTFSTKILKEMNKQKLPGEATFMSLNRLNVSVPTYPETGDAIPMIAQLNFQPKFDKAIRQVFGRTLLCRNLATATEMARNTGLDCVTIEGDKVSARGPLSGGYFDPARSRMTVHQNRTKINEELNKSVIEISNLHAEISKTDQEIVDYVTKIQKAENRNSKAKDNLEKFNTDMRLAKGELAMIERYRASKNQSLAQCTSSLVEIKAKMEDFEIELEQELTSHLSVADERLVDELNDNIRRLTKENKDAFSKRMELEAEKNKLENLLLNNLVRRKDELIQALQKISVEDHERKLESAKAQLEQVDASLVNVNAELKTLSDIVFEAVGMQKVKTSELENLKTNEKEAQDTIEASAKDLEQLSIKEFLVQKKITEFTQKMSELEALPNHDIYRELSKKSTKELLGMIENINKELKQYSHVNKKAVEQFMSFSEQKVNFCNRKEELDRGTEKIKELMFVLEQKKYEAIQFTFKQVSKNFSEIFKRLVPDGYGQLIIRTMNGEEEDDAESVPDSEHSDRFAGVGIRVSFMGDGDTQEMNQLSGGQKSLVALTLIFAIQRCDPAPFYLFDEIDQALDAEHRRAVADMIHELSEEAQFITTTFRSELLTHANKFYGVKFRNKVSHVECISLEEASEFIKDDNSLE